ncbi:MAG: cadherin-like domain-containing protein, partial [Hyphomicrobiaceae bacterium]|nr:cadherin-like domain-containing protein [Hyphomicrobiaceae bacterium]
TYTVTDGALTDTAVLNLGPVAPFNDAPVANIDVVDTLQNTPVSLDPRGNDTDPDGDPLVITAINGVAIDPTHPVVVPGGTVTITLGGGLVFTPDAEVAGPVTFAYTISDGQGGTATATITVNIREGGPNAPVVPVIPDRPIEFPTRSDAGFAGIDVRGAVLDAVNRIFPLGFGTSRIGVTGIVVDTVNGISPLSQGLGVSSLSDVASQLPPDQARTIWETAFYPGSRSSFPSEPEGLTGFSLRLGLAGYSIESSDRSQVIIETLVRERTLIVQISNTAGSEKRVVDYRVLRADGGPAPAWLDRVGPNLLVGQRPADVEQIGLRVIVVFSDGTTEAKSVSIETMSGEIKPLLVGDRADIRLPFMEQLAGGNSGLDREFERALEQR